MTVASSPTKEGILKLINEYYFTTNCIIKEDNTVWNTKLNRQVGNVTTKKGRFYYASI